MKSDKRMRANMKTRHTHCALFVWLTMSLACAVTLPSFGQSVTYTTRSAFEAAIAGLAGIRLDVDFQGPLPPGGTGQPERMHYGSPLTVSGLTFRSGGPLIISIISVDGNRVLNNYDSLTPLSVDMNGPATAFGADFSSLLNPTHSSFLAAVTLDNGTGFTFTAPADPNFAFFGFVTMQPFWSLTFSDGGLIGIGLHEEILDNITVVTVPEPSVFALFALGALFLGCRIHKTRKP